MTYVQRFWGPLVALATWLVTSVAAFISFPIRLSSTSNIEGVVTGAVIPLVAIVCGFLAVLPRLARFNSKPMAWLQISAIFFVVFLICIALYLYLQLNWTCQYADSWRLVIGESPKPGCEAYMMEIGGMTESVYDRNALVPRFFALAATYIAAWLALAALVMSLANAARFKRKPRASPTARPKA